VNEVRCEKCGGEFFYVNDNKSRIYCALCGKWQRNFNKSLQEIIIKELTKK